MCFVSGITGKIASNKSIKPFACGSLGHSALHTRSGMATPLLPGQVLRTEYRLPRRYVQKNLRSVT